MVVLVQWVKLIYGPIIQLPDLSHAILGYGFMAALTWICLPFLQAPLFVWCMCTMLLLDFPRIMIFILCLWTNQIVRLEFYKQVVWASHIYQPSKVKKIGYVVKIKTLWKGMRECVMNWIGNQTETVCMDEYSLDWLVWYNQVVTNVCHTIIVNLLESLSKGANLGQHKKSS